MIADQRTHRVLAYIDSITRSGGTLSPDELEGYALSPDRVPPSYRDVYSLTMAMDDSLRRVRVPNTGESAYQYLSRLGWIDSVDGIRLTELGRLVLRELNRPKVDVDSNDPITVVIDPEDPFAHVRIFELISTSTGGLLIDPHLESKQLRDVVGIESVSRVLIGDSKRSQFEMMRMTLAAAEDAPEVRWLPRAKLHDRFFIPDTGDVLSFGSSLNSITKRPGVVIPIADRAAAGAIRTVYEKLWLASESLVPDNAEASLQ